jgi:hypothetical protein
MEATVGTMAKENSSNAAMLAELVPNDARAEAETETAETALAACHLKLAAREAELLTCRTELESANKGVAAKKENPKNPKNQRKENQENLRKENLRKENTRNVSKIKY